MSSHIIVVVISRLTLKTRLSALPSNDFGCWLLLPMAAVLFPVVGFFTAPDCEEVKDSGPFAVMAGGSTAVEEPSTEVGDASSWVDVPATVTAELSSAIVVPSTAMSNCDAAIAWPAKAVIIERVRG